MDSSFEETALDPLKCSKMSIDQKRELIYELSKRSDVAFDILQSWSRQEILQILCAEMGKERKYTGLTKVKIIEALLKIISEKKYGNGGKASEAPSQRNPKRQRKTDNPTRLAIPMNDAAGSGNSINGSGNDTIYCKNLACRATMRQEDLFCKRCSCCICCLYDDNKDPSLWLTCSSEPPFTGDSCGLSCHLECAFKHEKSGVGKDRRNTVLDGSFYCVSCGKINDLLGCWRKQLMVAKDTRRVDILCYRLSLGQKLLKGTTKYQKLSEVVDEAVKKLEAEVGPLTGLPVKMGRGIVNRLHSGPDVQKLCSFALESLDKTISDTVIRGCSSGSDNEKSADSNMSNSTRVRFEDVHSTSLTVILGPEEYSPGNIVHYSLWHRRVSDNDYPAKSTCSLFTPNTKFVISGLTPATEYSFKVVSFSGTREMGTDEIKVSTKSNEDGAANCSSVLERSESPVTNCSSLSNPSSVEDESNNIMVDRTDNYLKYCKETETKIVSSNLSNEEGTTKMVSSEPDSDVLEIEKNHLSENQMVKEIIPDNNGWSGTPTQNNISEGGLPITPFRSDQIKNVQARTGKSKSCNLDNPENIENGSTTKKKEGNEVENRKYTENNGVSDSDFEHCVKVIRQLECLGHIEKNFRQKFLTWYSLRATQQEIRVVKVFIDTFMDDPTALAEQIIDTFLECVLSKRSMAAAMVPAGFCMKLWH